MIMIGNDNSTLLNEGADINIIKGGNENLLRMICCVYHSGIIGCSPNHLSIVV